MLLLLFVALAGAGTDGMFFELSFTVVAAAAAAGGGGGRGRGRRGGFMTRMESVSADDQVMWVALRSGQSLFTCLVPPS